MLAAPAPGRKVWLLPIVVVVTALMVLPASTVLAADSPHAPLRTSSHASTSTHSGNSPSSGSLFQFPSLTAPRPPNLGDVHVPSLSSPIAPPKIHAPSLSSLNDRGSPSLPSLSSVSAPSVVPPSPLHRELAPTSPTYASGPDSPAEAQTARLIAEGIVPPWAAYLPNPELLSGSGASGVSPFTVSSPYSMSPAPMGLADLGLNTSGPYTVATPGVSGNITLEGYNATAGPYYEDTGPFLNGGSPNAFSSPYQSSLQLNSVLTNVSIPGSDTGVYWIQNVVDFSGGRLQLVDNIWNFSGPTAVMNIGTLWSGNGHLSPGAFYYDLGPSFPLSFPLTIALYNNATTVAGRTTVSFGFRLTEGVNVYTGAYDQVSFNSVPSSGTLLPPDFVVNGSAPVYAGGPLYDAEFVFGGPGDGSNAVITNLSGWMNLSYDLSSTWTPAPAAYDYGADTGETAIGFTGWWGGSTEFINQGPAMLYGLWNTTNGVGIGYVPVVIYNAPAYALDFVGMNGSSNWNLSYFPSAANGTAWTWLPPSSVGYNFTVFADGFDQLNASVPASRTSFGSPPLVGYTGFAFVPNPASWNAPVYLNGPTQAAAFATYALGETSGAYVLGNLTIDVNLTFNHMNEFGYPEFDLLWASGLTNYLIVDNVTQGPDTSGGVCANTGLPWTCYLGGNPTGYVDLPGYGGELADWSSDYFALFENLTLVGYSTAAPGGPAVGGAVFLWQTEDAGAVNITSLADSWGVWAADTLFPFELYSLGSAGGVAFTPVNSPGPFAENVGASDLGTAVADIGSPGGYFLNLSATSGALAFAGLAANYSDLFNITANDSTGLALDADVGLFIENVTATNGSTGLIGEDLTGADILNLSANDSLGGELQDSGAIAVRGLFATNGSLGMVLDNVSYVDVADALVTQAEGILGENLTNTTFEQFAVNHSPFGVNASDLLNTTLTDFRVNDSEGVNLTVAVNTTIDRVTATNTSVGLRLWFVNDTTAQNVTALDGSWGLYLSHPDHTALANVTAAADSLGALLVYANNSEATNIVATDDSDGVGFGSVNNSVVSHVVAANESSGVLLFQANNTIVKHVSATNESFDADGVYAESANNTVLEDIASLNGSYGAYLEFVNNTVADPITATNESYGLYLWGANNTFVDGVIASTSSDGAYIQHANDTVVLDVTATANSIGLVLDFANSTAIADVTASARSLGVDAGSVNTTVVSDVRAVDESGGLALGQANGTTITTVAAANDSTGAELFHANETIVGGVIATNDSYGVYILQVNNTTISGVTATINASTGAFIVGANNTTVDDLTAQHDASGLVGSYLHNVSVDEVDVVNASVGVDLSWADDAQISNVSVTVLRSIGVGLANCTEVNVTNVLVTYESFGTVGIDSQSLKIVNVSAMYVSFGSILTDTSSSVVSKVVAEDRSDGTIVVGSTHLEVTNVAAAYGSNGTLIDDSDHLEVSNVSAEWNSNGTIVTGSEDLRSSNVTAEYASNGTLVNDSSDVSVTEVGAFDRSNGTWVNDSAGVDILNVTAEYGSNGTLVNGSELVSVGNVIARYGANGSLVNGSRGLSIWNVSVRYGANGTLVNASEGLSIWDVSAYYRSNDTLLNHSEDISTWNVSASDRANGTLGNDTEDLYGMNILAEEDSNGTLLNDSEFISLYNVSAEWYSNGTLLDGSEYVEIGNVSADLFSNGTLAAAVQYLEQWNTTVETGRTAGFAAVESHYLWVWNTTASDGAFGAGAIASTEVAFWNTTASYGAVGVVVADSSEAWVNNTSAAFGSTGVEVPGSEDVGLLNISAVFGSTGANISGSSEVSVTNVTATDDSYGVLVATSSDITVVNVVVTDAQGVGVLVEESDGVGITNVSASEFAYGVDLYDSTMVSVTKTLADLDAVGVLANDSTDIAVNQTTAENESIGVFLGGSSDSWVNRTTAQNWSVGVALNGTTSVRVLTVVASDPYTTGPDYTVTPLVPFVGAVVEAGTTHTTVDGITATDYPIAFFDSGSMSPVVTEVDASGGDYGIVLNGTEFALITDLTASRDAVGVQINDDAYDNVLTASRFLNNTGFGVDIESGGSNLVYENDFIDNNGATSVYSAAHLQAFSATPDNAFNNTEELGNYWADWHSYTDGVLNPYYVGGGAWDYHPLGARVGMSAVMFEESGLPVGTDWSVTFNDTTESTVGDALVFDAFAGNYSFTVGAISGWTVAPSGGKVEVASSPVSVSVGFSPVYNVTIEERGLASGTSWSALFNGVSKSTTGTSVVFSVTSGIYAYQVPSVTGYIASPASGTVTVSGNYTLEIGFTSTVPKTYTVWVNETGLTGGASWTAVFNGVAESTTGSSLSFTVAAGTYSYQVQATGYGASPSSGSVTVGGNYTILVTFTSAVTKTYTVWVNETGLTPGTSWTAVFNGVSKTTSGISLAFTVVAGTYAYQVLAVSGYSQSTSSGTVTVAGNYTIVVQFTAPPVPPTYTVWVNETGLATGTSWTAVFDGVSKSTAGPSLAFTVVAGSYAYQVPPVSGYSASTGGGTASVSGNYAIAVTFTPTSAPTATTTTVEVHESGLASGASWAVYVDGTYVAGTTSTLSVTVPADGTYAYQVVPVENYTVSPSSGTVSVGTSTYYVGVTFTLVTYEVTFSESGLGAGTSWSVTVNGGVHTTSGTSIVVYLPNGSFTYSFASVAGYTLSVAPSPGTVTGAPTGVQASYASTSTSSTGYVANSTFNLDVAIAIALGAIGLVAALVALLRKPRSPGPATPWQESPGQGPGGEPRQDSGNIADGAAKGQAQE